MLNSEKIANNFYMAHGLIIIISIRSVGLWDGEMMDNASDLRC